MSAEDVARMLDATTVRMNNHEALGYLRALRAMIDTRIEGLRQEVENDGHGD